MHAIIPYMSDFVKNFSSREGFIGVLYPMQRFVKNLSSREGFVCMQ